MLVYKASQVVAAQAIQSKAYSFKDERGAQRDGTSIYSDVTVLSIDGSVAVIRLKGKSEDEVKAKVSKLTIGKPAEIPIRAIEDSARGGVLILNA
jgi:hypothetical protein